MKYSIIIPTYNRLDELKELIPSLIQMAHGESCPPFELIIVDDGSTDGTEEYIQTLVGNIFPIHYFNQANQGPGAARNLGMQKAIGSYFIFVDSDCLIPPDYLIKIHDFLEHHPVDAFGGPDTFHLSFSPLLKAINYSMTSFIGTGGTRGSQKSIGKFYPRSFNMGFHRRVFDKIGGFNALRHGQDMDFSARIYAAGFNVGLISEAFVYHKRRTSLKKFFKQIFNWGIARINLSRLHPGFLKITHLAPAILVFVLITMLLLVGLGLMDLYVLAGIGALAIIVMLIAFSQSFLMYRSVKISLLSIITLYTQVISYGLGSLSGLFQIFILKRKEALGFVKKYYQ